MYTSFERHKNAPEHLVGGLLKSKVKTKKRTLYVTLLKPRNHNLLFLLVLFMEMPTGANKKWNFNRSGNGQTENGDTPSFMDLNVNR